MKLVRYGAPGREKPGLIDSGGRLRDLSGVVEDFGHRELSEEGLRMIAGQDAQLLPVISGVQRFGCPIKSVSKLIAIGLNYSDHAEETGFPIPEEPIVFMKAVSCIQGANDNVMLPKNSTKGDWEVELGVVIGSRARCVEENEAIRHVAGYCIVNDVSEREWQVEHGLTWDKGKGFDTFGPIGPWLVTKDEIADPHNLSMWLDLNGKRMQNSTTRNMIFSVEKLVSYVSQLFTLMPGDVITTGTPAGVGIGRTPPVYLKAGDVMDLGIDSLGQQSQRVVSFEL